MGINLLLVDKDGNEVPEWDWCRYAGDREFIDLRKTLKTIEREVDEEILWRPANPLKWMFSVLQPPFQRRHRKLLQWLSNHPELWLRVSW